MLAKSYRRCYFHARKHTSPVPQTPLFAVILWLAVVFATAFPGYASASAARQAPSAPVARQAPSASVARQAPSAFAARQAPSASAARQVPSASAARQAPSAPVARQAPPAPVARQAPSASAARQAPSALQEAPAPPRLRVSLLTILPGSEIYSLWGHSALRITDPRHGLDITYNYGTFDFEAGHFALKFLHGNLDYTLSTYWFEASLRAYQAQGRPVIEQTLDLTPAQQQRLTELLAVNLRPENRRYRYHFLFDNCSTRIRDILEAALGEETLHAQALPDDAPTFRALIDPYQRAVPFLDAGIDVLLGAPADRSADGRDIMFLPEYLMEAFGKAQIGMGETARPLVARTDTLFWIAGYGASGKRFPWEFVAAWLLFAGGLALTLRRPGVIRALDAPFFLAIGATGLLIAYLWFVSHHDVTNANRHLFWAWPTHALAAGVLLARRAPSRLLAIYMAAASAALIVSVLISPFVAQPFPAAWLPVALLAAVRAGAVALPGLLKGIRNSGKM